MAKEHHFGKGWDGLLHQLGLGKADRLAEEGNGRFIQGQYQEAIRYYDAALRVDPDFKAARTNRAAACERLTTQSIGEASEVPESRTNGIPEIRLFLWPLIVALVGLSLVLLPFGSFYQYGWSWWALVVIPLFCGLGLVLIWAVAGEIVEAALDLRDGPVEQVGRVTRRNKTENYDSYSGHTDRYNTISLGGPNFRVSGGIHEWVKVGDEVVIAYLPRSRQVVRVGRINRAGVNADGRQRTFWPSEGGESPDATD